MKPLRIDVAAGLPSDLLDALALTERVDVYCPEQNRQVGTCSKFWRAGDEVWAQLELVDGWRPELGMHAESICSLAPTKMLCIVLTSLPRGSLGAMMQVIADQHRRAN